MTSLLKIPILLSVLLSGFAIASIETFLNDLEQYKYIKKEINFGSKTLYLNYNINEFKDAVTQRIESDLSSTDHFYQFFGLNTDKSLLAKKIQLLFDSKKFNKLTASPGFTFIEIDSIYVNFNHMYNGKNINIKKFYGDAVVADSQDSTTSIKDDSVQGLKAYLDNLPSSDLIDLSVDQLVNGYYQELENNNNLDKNSSPKVVQENKVLRMVFDSWDWYLKPIGNNNRISIDEITNNNLDLPMVVLHEIAHLHSQGKLAPLKADFQDKMEKQFFSEIYSDVFTGVFTPSDNIDDHYKKIDSMMFSRILAHNDHRHFTVVPLMVLKRLISQPGFYDKYSSSKSKQDLVISLVNASGSYLTQILSIVKKLNLNNQSSVADDLQVVVENILKDMNNDFI